MAKKKKISFWLVMLIVLCSGFAVIIFGTVWFWSYMKAYEAARPEHAVERFIAELTPEALSEYIEIPESCSEFETKDEIYKYFKNLYITDNVTYRKDNTRFSEEKAAFYLLCGDFKIAGISFEKVGEGMYGFSKWGDGKIEKKIKSEMHGIYNMAVKAPHNARVKYRGVELESKYIFDDYVRYTGASEYETSDKLPYNVVYMVSDLYIKPSEAFVSVENAGNLMNLTRIEEGVYVYEDKFELKTVSFSYPEGSTIRINSIEVQRNGDKNGTYERNEFETGVPEKNTLILSGFYETPKITVTLSGQKLEQKDNVFMPVTKTVEAYVPHGCKLLVNGLKVNESYLTNQNKLPELLNGTEAYVNSSAYMDVYIISGLYDEPSIWAVSADGTEMNAVTDEEGSITFAYSASDIEKEGCETVATDFLKSYFAFTAEGKEAIEKNYADMMKWVVSGSDLYKSLKSMKLSLIYHLPFGVVYNKFEVLKSYIVRYGNMYIVQVQYDIKLSGSSAKKAYIGTNTLVMVKSGAELKICKMTIKSE